MVRQIGVLVGLAVAMWSAHGSADQTKYATSWRFQIWYPTGQHLDTSDETARGNIMMPVGSPWTCYRMPAALGDKGFIVAGFSCTNGAANVGVMGVCAATAADVDHAKASFQGPGGSTTLLADCETHAVGAPTPTKSFEKNL